MVANPLPPVFYEAPPVASQGFGLYNAATIIDDAGPARILGGVDLRSYNCDTGHGTYSTDLCDDTPATKAPGDRPEDAHFDPMVVYGVSECATDATEAEVLARARQNRVLHEPLYVESAFATMLLADAPAPTAAATLEEAIGILEEFLGEQGYAGYIHASRRYAVSAGNLNAANGSAQLRTNLQNTWVFGGGYASVLDNTLVATGPVTIWRSAPFEEVVTTGSAATGAHNNSVYAVSERVIVAGYECAILAVTITP
jgi:hypothetical protein